MNLWQYQSMQQRSQNMQETWGWFVQKTELLNIGWLEILTLGGLLVVVLMMIFMVIFMVMLVVVCVFRLSVLHVMMRTRMRVLLLSCIWNHSLSRYNHPQAQQEGRRNQLHSTTHRFMICCLQ